MQKKFLGLSGMPRSGSTLLSSILCQNPNIYSEGTSPLGLIMYETFNLLRKNAYNEMFNANKRPDTFFNIVSGLPEIYYNKVNEPIIIDKSRVWTGQECLYIMSNFITSNPKIVVMQRPLIDVVKSFAQIYYDNGIFENVHNLLDDNTNPIIHALNNLRSAKARNNGEYLFVEYDDLVNNPKQTIEKIYKFYEIELFNHQFDNIICKYPEDDSMYDNGKLLGLHDVRPTISKRHIDIELPEHIIKKCEILDIK